MIIEPITVDKPELYTDRGWFAVSGDHSVMLWQRSKTRMKMSELPSSKCKFNLKIKAYQIYPSGLLPEILIRKNCVMHTAICSKWLFRDQVKEAFLLCGLFLFTEVVNICITISVKKNCWVSKIGFNVILEIVVFNEKTCMTSGAEILRKSCKLQINTNSRLRLRFQLPSYSLDHYLIRTRHKDKSFWTQ